MRVLLVILLLCCLWYPTHAISMQLVKLQQHSRAESASTTTTSLTDTSACSDIPPSKDFTCYQQAVLWKKCNESWMKGFCLKSCGKCSDNNGNNNGGVIPPSFSNSPSLQELRITLVAGANSIIAAPLNIYGGAFSSNKNKLVLALNKATKVLSPTASPALAAARVRLGLCVAMLETNTFSPDDRDKTKTGMSTNYSPFNFNQDMLVNYLKMPNNQLTLLNDLANVDLIATTFLRAIQVLGVDGFLNFHRGGRSAYQDGVSYGAAQYRQAIASMVATVDANTALLSDNRRIDIVVPHV